ncbi:MAG TPA: TonB-dependent receptor [Vicinamibacterales bacterium]|nr:TonB-dependent receptor [Vicinamibacterales bacterium]
MRQLSFLKALGLAALIVSAASAADADGAQTGTLRGIVRDRQGVPVSGATVIVTAPTLQGRRENTTTSTGAYAIASLPPGEYQVTCERSGFKILRRSTRVSLGLTTRLDMTIGAADDERGAASVAAPDASPVVGQNLTHDEVDSLPMPRTLTGITELSPGLTNVPLNASQISISGAFAFDNVFVLDGVEINDVPSGSPLDLFVEDAIAETQTLASGIPAEYGRFSGGVVNAVTKSGGDRFSGGLRDKLTNPSWSTRTPYEVFTQARHKDVVDSHTEGTFGGPIAKSRMWFFGAGRFERSTSSAPLLETGAFNSETDRNARGELKVTATFESNQTVQVGFTSDRTEDRGRPSLGSSIDPFAVGSRTVPNASAFASYQAVIGRSLLAQACFSQQQSMLRDAGGTSTNVVDSPFLTLNTGREYNAPYFDAGDLEHRRSREIAASVQREWTRAGQHEIKGGYQWHSSRRTGGNEPSSTDYVFDADYALDPSTELPALDDSGHLIPLFVPGETRIEHSLPVRGTVLDVNTQSVYGQDHWSVNAHWSADLGVRYEWVSSETTGGGTVVNAHTLVPRLAAAYDVKADGRYVAHVTYGRYAGRFNETLIGASDAIGSVDTIYGTYDGPPGRGRTFAPGFDPALYSIDHGSFPSANVSLSPGLSPPITTETSASFGSVLGRRGYAEATYVRRETRDIIDDFIDVNNGATEVIRDGVDFGKFTNIVFANADVASRDYQALVLQTQIKITNRWSFNGHYTLMLRDEGNEEGATSRIGDYPGILDDVRHVPDGRLEDFQRHKLRVWSVYDFDLGRAGSLSASGLWRLNSGEVFSLRANNQPLTATQRQMLAAAGYPGAPGSQDVFFGARGSQQFPGYALFDASITYGIPLVRSLRPWVKCDVFNLFDNLKLIAWNTTVLQDRSGPKDSAGLATTYNPSPLFGKADSNADFPAALPGVSGGRTFRVAFGIRF